MKVSFSVPHLVCTYIDAQNSATKKGNPPDAPFQVVRPLIFFLLLELLHTFQEHRIWHGLVIERCRCGRVFVPHQPLTERNVATDVDCVCDRTSPCAVHAFPLNPRSFGNGLAARALLAIPLTINVWPDDTRNEVVKINRPVTK